MARVVILGGTGFIGTHINERLKRDGWETETLGRADTDLVDPDQIPQLAARWDHGTTVIFCAGLTRDRDASWHAARANILMAQHLAAALPKGGWRGILFLSSSAVYGRPAVPGPIHEDTPLKPLDPYGFSKVECESILVEKTWPLNTPFLALRPSIVFGRYDRGRSLVGRWADNIRRGTAVAVRGKGEARIDLLAVEDLCDVVAAWTRRPFGGALNVASGFSQPVTRWIQMIGEALGRETVIDGTSRSGEEEFDQIFDTSRLRTLLPDWSPREARLAIEEYVRSMGADSAA